MNRLTEEQRHQNQSSRNTWELYASHRQHVTQHVLGNVPNDELRLCILGAGNCNDLNLERLEAGFHETHLVDYDADALTFAARRQGVEGSSKVHCHGSVDVTGIAEMIGNWSPEQPPAANDLEQCLDRALSAKLPKLPSPFDVVVSDCLISQLINGVVLTLGERHLRFADLALRVRNRHLNLIIELLAPGGRGVLITDVVASETFPTLPQIASANLLPTIAKLAEQHNHFVGLNPFELHSMLGHDMLFRSRIGEVDFLPPWLWNFGPRTYAVCAISFRKLSH